MAVEHDFAETIALRALTWIVGQEELLPVFLGATGLAPESLVRRAGDADLLVSVLDFLLMDDAWVTGFCDSEGLAYDRPMAARHRLAGPPADDWA